MLSVLLSYKELIYFFPIVIATFFLFQNYLFGKLRNKSLKGPKGFPIIGNLFDLMPENFLFALEKYKNELGGIFELYVFSKRYVILSNLHLITEVLSKRPKIFRRSRMFIKNGEFLNLESGYIIKTEF